MAKTKTRKISFLGAGNMGEAMIKGLIRNGSPPSSITVYEKDSSRLAYITRTYKVKKADSLADALEADATVVAVKPKDLDALLDKVAGTETSLPLLISIAAGIPVSRFTDRLGPKARVVRVMPNTPALIGKGVSAYFAGPGVKSRDLSLAESIVKALGPCHKVDDEGLMDAVTGVSGSGPAYVFAVVEAMSDAGVKMGLPRAMATSLAANTVAGAAAMVAQTGEHPAALKDKVTSPGGTTIAGMAELERGGLRAALINAVEAATMRSRELGNPSKGDK
ncbi:MAG: pyrroline-5-carboxylate reductase [bacterium]